MFGPAAAAEKKLYDAASKGDVTTFRDVVEKDAYLLEGVTFACSRNLLHIATVWGQAGIVEEVLKMNPRLARSLDSQKSSPLHIAAAEGYVEIVKKLLSAAPEMCWSLDCQNMNPIHIAAINGHVEILEELILINYLPAMERLHRGQTVLHLCVKHFQLRALKVFVEKVGELVHAKDEDGETVLHWAVRSKQHEMIQYLEEHKKKEEETTKSTNSTVFGLSIRTMPRLSNESMLEFLSKMSDTTMVVSVLIATMAFQGAVSPPGGVWQDDSSTHKAGQAVMASTDPTMYNLFVFCNTIAFSSSLVTIILLSTRLTSYSIYFLVVAFSSMWSSLSSIEISYIAASSMITPDFTAKPFLNLKVLFIWSLYSHVIPVGVICICGCGSWMMQRVVSFSCWCESWMIQRVGSRSRSRVSSHRWFNC